MNNKNNKQNKKQGVLQPIKNEVQKIKQKIGQSEAKAVHTLEKVLHSTPHKLERRRKPATGHAKSLISRSKGHIGSASGAFSVTEGGYMKNTSNPHQRFRIRCEKVGDVVGNNSSTSNTQTFNITPANTTLFPIFSNTAVSYQKWKPYYMRFHFLTEMYNVSNAVTAGKVIMGVNYDADSVQVLTDNNLEEFGGAVAGAPYVKNMMCDAMSGGFDRKLDFWVDPNNSIENRINYMGTLNLVVINTAATTSQIIGEIYVEFGFDMYRPCSIPNNLALYPFFLCKICISYWSDWCSNFWYSNKFRRVEQWNSAIP